MASKVWQDEKIAAFCLELGLSLKSGIPVNEIIYMLYEGEADKRKKEQLLTIYNSLEDGDTLTKSLSTSGAFPLHLTDMISIGERTGNSDKVFLALSEFYNGKKDTKATLKSAFTYPIIIAVMLLIVLFVLLSQVLPIFSETFKNLGLSMSPFATSMMNFGVGITKYFMVILAVILAIFVIGILIYANDKMRVKLSDFFEKLFSGSSISKKFATYNFASSLQLVLSSGIDMEESLKIIKENTKNKILLDKIDKCIKELQNGESISEAVSDSGLFPPIYSRMLSIGFKTGNTDVVMEEIINRTKSDLSQSISNIAERVEPTIVIIMSLVIGLILLSVMLPLLGIMTAIS